MSIKVISDECLALQAEIEHLQDAYNELFESNKDVWAELEDIPYNGSFADGVRYLKEENERLRAANWCLIEAQTK